MSLIRKQKQQKTPKKPQQNQQNHFTGLQYGEEDEEQSWRAPSSFQ